MDKTQTEDYTNNLYCKIVNMVTKTQSGRRKYYGIPNPQP